MAVNLIELWTLLLVIYAIYRIETMPKGLLSYRDLVRLVKRGVISAPVENINATSIDVTLDDTILIEDEKSGFFEVDITDGYYLQPGQFCLAATKESFNLPRNISAEYKLTSGNARAGLDHSNAGWCLAGWSGSKLTLELTNHREHKPFLLKSGNKIGQIVFFEHKNVPDYVSYAAKGRYNKQDKVTESKQQS